MLEGLAESFSTGLRLVQIYHRRDRFGLWGAGSTGSIILKQLRIDPTMLVQLLPGVSQLARW